MQRQAWRRRAGFCGVTVCVASLLILSFASEARAQDPGSEHDELQEILNRLGKFRSHSKHSKKTDENVETAQREDEQPIPHPEERAEQREGDDPIQADNLPPAERTDQELETAQREGVDPIPADILAAERADPDLETTDKREGDDQIPAEILAAEREDQDIKTGDESAPSDDTNPPEESTDENDAETDAREGEELPPQADDNVPPAAERIEEDLEAAQREGDDPNLPDFQLEKQTDAESGYSEREVGDDELKNVLASSEKQTGTGCTFYWAYKPNYYAYGSMLSTAGSTSIYACSQQCINKPFCDGFSWTQPSYSPYCRLSGPWTTSLRPFSGLRFWALVRRCPTTSYVAPFSVLVQQRTTAASYFNQVWSVFKGGFGSTAGSYYWIGNDLLSLHTAGNQYKIRFQVQSQATSRWYYADYSSVYVYPESYRYRLLLGSYSGNAGNAMSYHSGQRFSTRDRDYDAWSGNCAGYYSGGFWHKSCYTTGINAGRTPTSTFFKWNGLPGGNSIKASRVWLMPRYCRSILVHRRYGYTTYFHRNWADFKYGFGTTTAANYWIGNDVLHELTATGRYKLLFQLQSLSTSRWYYAWYSSVYVGSESTGYRLYLGTYSGTAGYDAMRYVHGYRFSTYDRDNDASSGNCASSYRGGFWYRTCYQANVNAARTPNNYYYKWHGLPGGYSLRASRIWLVCK